MDVGTMIETLGGPQALAEAVSRSLGMPYSFRSANSWKKRRRVPAHLALPLLDIAEGAGPKAGGVDLASLPRLVGPRKPRETKKPALPAALANTGAAA